MSIETEFQSTIQNVQNAYNGLNNLGATIPQNKTIENIKSCLDEIYDNLPKTEYQEGTEINLGKTIKGKLDYENGIVGIGQSSQESTKGYQLLNYNNLRTPATNVGISVDENGVVSGGNADSRSWAYASCNWQMTLPAGTYRVSLWFIEQITSSNGYFNIYDSNGNTIITVGVAIRNVDSYTTTFTLSEETSIGIILKSFGSKYKIMLESGSTAHDWEQYTGGYASPNPSYPQTINSVTGNQDVVVQNKNLCTEMEQGDVSTSTGEASSYQPTTSGFIRSKDYIPVKPSEVITVSYKNTATSSIQIVIFEYNANKTYIGFYYSNASTYTRTLGNETAYIKIRLQDTTNTLSNNTEIQVEYGNTKTSYVEHQEHSYQLSLGDIELNAIGNYADELIYDVDEDKVYKNEKIKEYVLSNLFWAYNSSPSTPVPRTTIRTTGITESVDNFLSNIFDKDAEQPNTVKKYDNLTTYISMADSITGITSGDTDTQKLQKMLAVFTNKNANLLVIKTTPTLIEITDTNLHNQVKALYNAHSNNGTTILESNGDLPMIIKVRALKGE